MDQDGNAIRWFLDRHLGAGRGENIAFEEADGHKRRLTYAELSDQAARMAGALTRAGVKPGERAAMLVLDQIEFPMIFWGALRAGVVPVPLNTLLATPVYANILRDCGASVVFISQELLPAVMPACADCPDLRQIVVLGVAPEGTISFTEFTLGADMAPTVAAKSDDVAFWLYSSGSTGRPKGVRHRHGAMQLTCETYGAQVLGIRETDTVYSVAKLFFAYGLGNGMTFPMSVGGKALLFSGRPTPDSVTGILERYKPDIFCGVPTLYAALVHQWRAQGGHPDAPLRTCISAGEALPAEIGRAWQAMWGCDILDGVGSTEMLHIFLSNAPGDVVYGTSGTAVPGYEVRLVDDAGNTAAEGEVGELFVRGGSSAADYWNQPEKTAATFQDGWTRTGDKYEQTADGRMVYCGRTDDMFKVSGVWVSPFEVEQALASHPAILEAAVVSRRDGDNLEKPMAFVVVKPGQSAPDDATLKQFVKDKVGKWKYPRWIEVVEDLPKTATGKIQRFKLRDPD